MSEQNDATAQAPAQSATHDRRRFLSAAAAGAAGVVVGLGGGALIAGRPNEPVAPRLVASRRFVGKVVLITEATSGIGRAAARLFAAEGAMVGFCGRREALGHQVEQEIRSAGGEARYVRADVLVESDVKSFVDQVVGHYGRLDVAFNNAGITIEKPLHEYTSDEWDRVVNTNLRGTFLAMKYEVPYMIRDGGGTIVVTSSSNALATTEHRSAYTASKRGLVGLVQSATFDYAQHNIRVNALIPGTTDTALVRRAAGMEVAPDAVWEAAASQWAKSHVPGLQRMATPEEIAQFALMLASTAHPYMTGAQMVIDGGRSAYGG